MSHCRQRPKAYRPGAGAHSEPEAQCEPGCMTVSQIVDKVYDTGIETVSTHENLQVRSGGPKNSCVDEANL